MGPGRTERELRDAGRRRRRFAWGLVAICGLALLLRLVVGQHLYETYRPVVHPATATDNATYQTLARAILDGTYDYSSGFYYQPFYYAVFLPALLFASKGGVWSVVVAQAVLGALTAGLVGLIFARLGGRACGLLAALFVALSRTLIFYTPFTLIEILQSFWLALLAATVLWAMRRRTWWVWTICGLFAGCANASRGNIVLLLPVVVLALLYSLRQRRALALLATAALLVAFYLPQLPFAWANYRAHGHWTGPSSAAGAVLALGNTPEAPPGGRDPDAGAGPMEYPPSYGDFMARDAAPVTSAGQRSVAASAGQWFKREPLAFVELKWRIFLLFWHRGEIPNNVALPLPGQPGAHWLLNGPWLLDFLLLGGLGFAGLLLSLTRWRRHPAWWLTGGLVWLYCGSIVVFYMLGRFRLPIVPLICGFAAWMVVQLFRRYRIYRRHPARSRPLAQALGVFILAMLVVGFGHDLWRMVAEAPVMRLVRPNGVDVLLLDRELRYDHGPQSFGGWYPLRASDFAAVEKTFVARPRTSAEGIAYGSASLHLAIFGDTSLRPIPTARVTVLRDGQPVARQDVTFTQPGGLIWVDIPLPLDAIPAAALASSTVPASVTLAFRVDTSDPNGVSLIFDNQRDYGRTRVLASVGVATTNTQSPTDLLADMGECVVELHLFPATPSAPVTPTEPDTASAPGADIPADLTPSP